MPLLPRCLSLLRLVLHLFAPPLGTLTPLFLEDEIGRACLTDPYLAEGLGSGELEWLRHILLSLGNDLRTLLSECLALRGIDSYSSGMASASKCYLEVRSMLLPSILTS